MSHDPRWWRRIPADSSRAMQRGVGAVDDFMRDKLPDELRVDKDIEARACSFLELLCGAAVLISCYLVVSTLFLALAPHHLSHVDDPTYSRASSSSSYLLFFSPNFLFIFSSSFTTYFFSSPAYSSSTTSSSLSSSLTTPGGTAASYSASSSTSAHVVPQSTHTAAAVLVVLAGVALIAHAAIVCLLMRTRSLRLAVAAYLLFLDLNLTLWCISEGHGVLSSGFLGFSVLTLWTSFMLGIPAGLLSLGVMLLQAGAFHALSSEPHEGVQGRLVMLVAISLSAIVLQKLAEESKGRLQQKSDLLKAGSNARTKLFNSLSHELRTPMHGIIAMSDELMKMPSLERGAQEAAEIVNECADHLLSLLDNILDFARIESGKLEFENVLFDLPLKMAKTVNLLAAHAKNKQIVLEVSSALSDPHRVGDSVRVRQVLFNLLSNSIKFTPPGHRITLEFCDARVANPREGEPCGELEEGVVFFRVTDTGIGIPEKQLHRLFKSFSQVDKSISRKFGGTGLGLAICKHLAHGMGGQIGVSSQHGKGSTFWFTAALPAASPWPYHQKLEAEKRERERDEGRSVLQGRRILVIDDNVINQKVAVKMLSSVGCDVVVASSGANALELLREEEELKCRVTSADSIEAIDEVDDHYNHQHDHQDQHDHEPQQQPKHGFDAILCDIEMPELDGFGTAVKIREQERRFAALAAADNDGRGRGWQHERESRTPIIALSAFHSEEYRVRCRESGMSDYMSKPVKKDALVSCLAKWCNDPSALWRLIATCPLTSDDSDCSVTSSKNNSNSNSDEEEEELKATLIGGSGDVPFECRPTA